MFVDIAPADQGAVEVMWASYVADSGYDGSLVTGLRVRRLRGVGRRARPLGAARSQEGDGGPRAGVRGAGRAVAPGGDRCLVLGGDGRPLAIVRTTDVRVGPLWSVDDRFAWDEGEGDRTRAWWLDAHTRFSNRQCTAMGLTFSDDIGVVFERFELVWPTIRT
jgi:hypothetical protein